MKQPNPKLAAVRKEVTRRRNEQALKAVELRVSGLSFARVGKRLGIPAKKAQTLCAVGVRLMRAARVGEPEP